MDPRRHELVRMADMIGRQLRAAEQFRERLQWWRDPRAKALRRRRRAVRATKVWTGTGLTAGAGATVVEITAVAPTVAGPSLIGAAAVTGIAAVVSGFRAWRLHREPLPEAPRKPAPLPASGSLAREPMRELSDAEDALRQLLAELAKGALVPPDSVEHARRTGAEAAAALRAVADQLQAVERARDHAPAADRGHLTAGVRALRAQLDDGLDGYRGLVSAAGQALAAAMRAEPRHDLVDATDHLAALAAALRELAPRTG